MKKRTNNFTEGKILSPLLKFALPILLALFLQALYGAVDLAVVGQFAKTVDVSAVATGSQIMQSITFVLASLCMGITILLGQKIGEKRQDEAGKVVGSGIWLFALIALFFTVVCTALSPQICEILQAPKKAFSETVSYVRVCSLGIVFIIAFNTIGSIFRGIGDSKMPLVSVAIACVVNIIADLLFVAVLGLGALGAALATVLAQAISVILSLFIISKKELPFDFKKSYIKPDKPIMSRILKFGVPIALQDLLVSISFLIIMAIINSLGLTQSAAVGVAEKVCAFLMLMSSAFMQALSAFVAQNIGANKPNRAKKALLFGMVASIVTGTITFYFSFFQGDMLSKVFTEDNAVVVMASDYLKAYAFDCIFTSIEFCLCGYYNGLGKTKFVMIQGIAGAFLVRVPLSYFISRISGVRLFYIGLSVPVSTVFQIIICILYFVYLEKQKGGKKENYIKI